MLRNNGCQLAPIKWFKVRWSGMLRRYDRMERFLEVFGNDTVLEPETEEVRNLPPDDARKFAMVDCLPNPHEKMQIQNLLEDLKGIQQATKLLQKNDCKLEGVRDIFDELIKDHPEMEEYLAPDSNIVESGNFETGIVKVQCGREDSLTAAEKAAISCFRLVNPQETQQPQAATALSLEERINRAKRMRLVGTTQYIGLNWIPATSDLVERFFSQAKLVLSDLRKGMSPITFESIMFLKMHLQLWSHPEFVRGALNGSNEAEELIVNHVNSEKEDEDDFVY